MMMTRPAFVCPTCRRPLVGGECATCARTYESTDGIQILRADASPGAREQAAFFDEVDDPEFEIERPRGTPLLHQWMIGEKVHRALGSLSIENWSVLIVCGGSGMDAELLAKMGADVISSDISIGAATRALARAKRHGFAMTALVADVECLPFSDRSVDLVYVHDGLHHIDEPLVGLREMARVARRAVCVTEPANASITSLAVRLGIAVDREEAGNRVARLRVGDLRNVLENEGFRIARAQRYGMFYRHKPGIAMRVLSYPILFPFVTFALRFANSLVGRFGNKLSVQAVRR